MKTAKEQIACLLQILSHCPSTLEVSKAIAKGGNACRESQSEMAISQEDFPAGLLSGAHCLCLRAPAWSNSDSGQQLPCGLKVPFRCPQLAAWLLTSSVWATQGLIHGHTTHTQKDAHLIQFPAIATLKSFYCLIESSHIVILLWSCEVCVQYFDMKMVRMQWTTL